MIIQLAILFTLVGIATGSFLNVCIDRLPRRKSLNFPASHCDACQHPLKLTDLIPIASYLFLRGRCRYCRARLPLRMLTVEAAGGLLFFLAYWQYGLSAWFGITVFWGCVFLVIMFIDWEHQLILNRITYPAAGIALVIMAVNSFVPGADFFPGRIFYPDNGLYSGLASGAVILVFFLLIAIIRPGAMGMGDVKLVALIGFVSGFPLVVFSMLIGVVIGGVVAIYLLAAGKKGRKDVIPYGTFLAIGPIIALIFERQIVDWYLKFF
ncbi:MAG: prepilin peptidase [Dehalococcoidales bacterium]|jgi:leader peptidase (prepilin peptidase)/N-methyltransferase